MKKFLVLTAGMLATGSAAAIDDLHFYVGLDQAELDVVSIVNVGADGDPNTPQTARAEADSSMIRLRGGGAINENLALEVQYGFEGDDTDLSTNPPQVALESYLGIFLVPSAYLTDYLQLEVPLGYGQVEFDGADEEGDRAYGLNLNLYPLRIFNDEGSKLISLSGGFMVYYRADSERVDGYNFGLKVLFGNDE
ncbi:MAG: hypothetical protein CMP06_04055 [Xanthomonadales bacterium]|nr:hypothetical protein [Xanthomonadales bacterium]